MSILCKGYSISHARAERHQRKQARVFIKKRKRRKQARELDLWGIQPFCYTDPIRYLEQEHSQESLSAVELIEQTQSISRTSLFCASVEAAAAYGFLLEI
jgi:hypothetical protein